MLFLLQVKVIPSCRRDCSLPGSEKGEENYKVAKFTASDAAPNDYFGASVVIGADLDDGAAGINSGSVYILGDVNEDNRIGLEEVLYDLIELSE
ncbi:MAG: hypothetical protein GY702_12845 [Desulfobulbaceae bacterium]|nr:hypothetical protein [Desulfobulbaceae bacterium]